MRARRLRVVIRGLTASTTRAARARSSGITALSADLGTAVGVGLVLTLLLLLWAEPGRAARGGLGVAALLYVPGSAVVRSAHLPVTDGMTRATIGFASGLALVSALVLALGVTDIPILFSTISLSLAALTLTLAPWAWRSRHDPANLQRVHASRPLTGEPRSWRLGRGHILVIVALLFAWSSRGTSWTLTLLLAAFAVLAVVAVRRIGQQPAMPTLRIPWGGALLPALLLSVLATRLAMFVRSPVPTGYDTGMYRGLQREFATALPHLPDFAERALGALQPPVLFLITDVLHVAGWPADASLWVPLFATQLLLGIGVYLLARDIGGRASGLWALMLFALSSTQLAAFWQVYYKQLLALALFLLVLWLWRRRSWVVVPVGAAVAGSHNMVFLLMGLVLLTDYLWPRRAAMGRLLLEHYFLPPKRFQLAAGTLILLFGLAFYLQSPAAITQYVSIDPSTTADVFGLGAPVEAGEHTRVGPEQFQLFTLFLMPLAVLGAVTCWRHEEARPPLIFALWSLVYVILEFLFFRRFLISLDLAVIVLAAPVVAALGRVLARDPAAVFVVSAVVLGSATFYVRTWTNLGPYLPYEEIRYIGRASQIVPRDSFVIATSGRYAAWVYGYSERRTVAAGMFEENERWSLEEWADFFGPRTPADRHRLLERYGSLVYVHVGGDQPTPDLSSDPRLEEISQRLWVFR